MQRVLFSYRLLPTQILPPTTTKVVSHFQHFYHISYPSVYNSTTSVVCQYKVGGSSTATSESNKAIEHSFIPLCPCGDIQRRTREPSERFHLSARLHCQSARLHCRSAGIYRSTYIHYRSPRTQRQLSRTQHDRDNAWRRDHSSNMRLYISGF